LRLVAVVAIAAVLLAPVAWKVALKDYQKSRIETFIDPEQGSAQQRLPADPGAGHRRLRRAQRQRVPEGDPGAVQVPAGRRQRFHLLGPREEQGFIGVLVALGLYLFVILRSIEAARLAKDRIGAYLVGGIISGFAFQVIYNVTMSAGLAPVKGLTLPLMSYGGSSMIATLAAFGLILNVRMRRFTN
jgi:rod shape determining protein RodA